MFAVVDEKQRALLGVDVAFTVIPTLALLLRLYCRLKLRGMLTATDYCLIAALILAWSITASGMAIVLIGGVGLHQDELTLPTIITYLKILFSIELLWSGAQGLLKTSICLFFIEIFPAKRFRVIAYCVIALCVTFALTVVFSTTFICNPIELSWDPTIPGHCANRNALWLAVGLLNIFTDLVVLILPVYQIWKLHISLRKKLMVSGIFGLGFFVCIVSIVRLKYLLAVDFYGDTSYTVTDAIIWSTLEPTTGVTVACLPSYGYLLRSWTEKSQSKDSGFYYRTSKDRKTRSKRDGKGSQGWADTTMEYPLVSVAVGSDARESRSDQTSTSDAGIHSQSDDIGSGQITVKREWHVSHSKT